MTATSAEEILDFERRTAGVGSRRKRSWIWAEFGISPTVYFQQLVALIESPAAIVYAPDVVARLRRLRDDHRALRSVPHPDPPDVVAPSRRQQQLPIHSARPRVKEESEVSLPGQLPLDRINEAERSLEEAGRAIGEAKAQIGMGRAERAADPDWKADVDAAIAGLAAKVDGDGRPIRFTAEDVRALAGDPPDHPNAMGARFQRASRNRVIRWTGEFQTSSRPSLHAHPIRVWQGAARPESEGEVS